MNAIRNSRKAKAVKLETETALIAIANQEAVKLEEYINQFDISVTGIQEAVTLNDAYIASQVAIETETETVETVKPLDVQLAEALGELNALKELHAKLENMKTSKKVHEVTHDLRKEEVLSEVAKYDLSKVNIVLTSRGILGVDVHTFGAGFIEAILASIKQTSYIEYLSNTRYINNSYMKDLRFELLQTSSSKPRARKQMLDRGDLSIRAIGSNGKPVLDIDIPKQELGSIKRGMWSIKRERFLTLDDIRV